MRPIHYAALVLCASAAALPPLVVAAQDSPVRWTLAARPAVLLDGEEPEALLQKVHGATRLADGSIMVGDLGDYALRIFSPKGKVLKAFARKGSGPGEVRYLSRMFRCGDSVYTLDIEEGHRVSVFTLGGQYVRVFNFWAPAGQSVPYASACNRRGEFVHYGWESRSDMKNGAFRSMVPVWTGRANDAPGVVIDSVAGSERWGSFKGGAGGTRPLPLGKQPVVAIGTTQLYVGSADRFEVKVATTSGRPAGVVSRAIAPAAVASADIRHAIDEEVDGGSASRHQRLEQSYAEMTLPKTLPAYTKMMVDAQDMLWIRPYPRGAPATVRWSVFDATRTLVAEVDVPTLLEVYEIGADYVLGRYLDPDTGTVQVRSYTLTRTRS